MKIYLARHAKAQRRLGWENADGMRPLSPSGHDQALGLVERFDGVPVVEAEVLPLMETVVVSASSVTVVLTVDVVVRAS